MLRSQLRKQRRRSNARQVSTRLEQALKDAWANKEEAFGLQERLRELEIERKSMEHASLEEKDLLDKFGRDAKEVGEALRQALVIVHEKDSELDATRQTVEDTQAEVAVCHDMLEDRASQIAAFVAMGRLHEEECSSIRLSAERSKVEHENTVRRLRAQLEQAETLAASSRLQAVRRATHKEAEVPVLHKTITELKRSQEALLLDRQQLQEKLIETENFMRTQEGQISQRFEKELATARCQYAQGRSDLDDMEAQLEDLHTELQLLTEKNRLLRAYIEDQNDHTDAEDADEGYEQQENQQENADPNNTNNTNNTNSSKASSHTNTITSANAPAAASTGLFGKMILGLRN